MKSPLIISDPNQPRWFSKKFYLNEKQVEALKSGNFIRSLQTGLDIDVIKAFNYPKNKVVLYQL
jgi:hypothetical protein